MKMLRQTAVLFQLFQILATKRLLVYIFNIQCRELCEKALAMRAAVRMTNALLRDGLRQRRICSRVDLRSFKLTRLFTRSAQRRKAISRSAIRLSLTKNYASPSVRQSYGRFSPFSDVQAAHPVQYPPAPPDLLHQIQHPEYAPVPVLW